MLKCPLLLVGMVVREGGRQETEATACVVLSVVDEEPGESSRKWDTSSLPTQVVPRWFLQLVLWHSGSDLSLPGLLHFQDHSTLNSANEGIINNCGISGFGFVICQLAVRVCTEPS